MKRSTEFPRIIPADVHITLGDKAWFNYSRFENREERVRFRATLEEKQMIADMLLDIGHRIKNENRADFT